MWGEEAEGVVAPVVGEPATQQVWLADEVVHRHQLDGSDTEPLQMFDRGGMRESGVRPADGWRHVRMARGESLDMHLVDDGVRPRRRRPRVLSPRERIGDDDRLRHERRRVAVVFLRVVLARRIAEDGVVEDELAVERAGVGVDQELAGVPAKAVPGVEGTVDAEAITLTRTDAGEVTVPDVVGDFLQRHAFLGVAVEQAQLDRLGCGGEEREVGAFAVPGGTERKRRTGPAVVLDVGHGPSTLTRSVRTWGRLRSRAWRSS